MSLKLYILWGISLLLTVYVAVPMFIFQCVRMGRLGWLNGTQIYHEKFKKEEHEQSTGP